MASGWFGTLQKPVATGAANLNCGSQTGRQQKLIFTKVVKRHYFGEMGVSN